jgi:exonuclease VII large subunit
VHWRADPSLREIWKQERLRMSKLLSPANDFLSANTQQQQQKQPVFTLSVKGKDTPTPGAQLAVEGMKRLIRVSEGLEENFSRAMKQIVERYAEKIDRIDQHLLKDQSAATTTPTSSSTSNPAGRLQMMELTPTFEETMKALGGLGGGDFGADGQCDDDQTHAAAANDTNLTEDVDLSAVSDPDTYAVENTSGRHWDSPEYGREIRRDARFSQSAEQYYNPKRFSQSQPYNDFQLSQLVE